MPALPPLERLLVVSPHLDDAVFGCGELLAAHPGSVVVTVFAGDPPPGLPLADWDRRCGFGSSDEAMPARRAEDRAALEVLGAAPRWLGFVDDQYAAPQRPCVAALADALGAEIDAARPDAVVLPMGLFHSDHERVHEAGLRLLRAAPGRLWLAVEDALYRRIPGRLQRRLVALAGAGIVATPAFPLRSGPPQAKRRALAHYASQLRAFGPAVPADLEAPERYWRLGLDEEGQGDDAR
ncbi:PIG-L deacetylase family protein [Caldimonas tepidiphila]|uniref:PIG-L deacetylase family protein n=1 Tax=Caldimonas tepidiphila TaxID=2315841 RepID=UPI000E5AE814|nr:PIG-L family deacetylase [Caldimonas tepidiphila]